LELNLNLGAITEAIKSLAEGLHREQQARLHLEMRFDTCEDRLDKLSAASSSSMAELQRALAASQDRLDEISASGNAALADAQAAASSAKDHLEHLTAACDASAARAQAAAAEAKESAMVIETSATKGTTQLSPCSSIVLGDVSRAAEDEVLPTRTSGDVDLQTPLASVKALPTLLERSLPSEKKGISNGSAKDVQRAAPELHQATSVEQSSDEELLAELPSSLSKLEKRLATVESTLFGLSCSSVEGSMQCEEPGWLEEARSLLELPDSQFSEGMHRLQRLEEKLDQHCSVLEDFRSDLSSMTEASCLLPVARSESMRQELLDLLKSQGQDALKAKVLELEKEISTLAASVGHTSLSAEKTDQRVQHDRLDKPDGEDFRLLSDQAKLHPSLQEEFQCLQSRLAILEQQRGESQRYLVGDKHCEVEHFCNALRGVQRDGDLAKGRLEDLSQGLLRLKDEVAVLMAQLVNALQAKKRQEGDSVSGDALEICGKRFVTGEALGVALERLDAGLKAELAKLRQELSRSLGDKAEANELGAFGDRLGQALEHMQALSTQLGTTREEMVDNAAIFRLPLLPGRCLSCSKKVEMTIDRRSPYDRREPQGAPWPSRAQSQSRLRRDSSLPSLGLT